MKALFIGGTGTISTAISRRVLEMGWDLYLLNRGNRNSKLTGGDEAPFKAWDDYSGASASGAKKGKLIEITCDIRSESEAAVSAKVKALLKDGEKFDCVGEFIAFVPGEVERDCRIFKDLTRQYFFISSASGYQKPVGGLPITESSIMANPYWKYSQDKIACEDLLLGKYRSEGFPVTIIRPSHTYDERNAPMGIHSPAGSWGLLKRILDGKKVIIHGDGTSLWAVTANRDFAKGFTGLMGNIHAIGETVHITSDEIVTWNQIYASVACALGKPLKAVHISSEFLAAAGDPKGYNFTGALIGDKANSVIFDNSKLKRLVPGFRATIRFDQGIRETVAYMLSHKECQKEDPEFEVWYDKIIGIYEKSLAELGKISTTSP
jgi:nucleoside-diphosphate-sugar epimerase